MNADDYVRYPKIMDPIKHAARWHINLATGHELTRRAHQKLKSGGIEPEEKAAIRRAQGIKTPQSKAIERQKPIQKAYKTNIARKLGISPKKVKIRGNAPEAVAFRKEARGWQDLTKEDLRDKSATGRLAQWLVRLGLRNPEWTMPVGESPK